MTSEAQRRAQRKYNKSAKGRASKRRYLDTEKGRETKNAYESYFATTPKGKAKKERWRRSLNGRAVKCASEARRRSGLPSGDFADVFRELHEGELSCEGCGCEYVPTHQVDHITPLAVCAVMRLEWANERENLQPLCLGCHKRKTIADQKLIAIARPWH